MIVMNSRIHVISFIAVNDKQADEEEEKGGGGGGGGDTAKMEADLKSNAGVLLCYE